jgi:hypothetical protein
MAPASGYAHGIGDPREPGTYREEPIWGRCHKKLLKPVWIVKLPGGIYAEINLKSERNRSASCRRGVSKLNEGKKA